MTKEEYKKTIEEIDDKAIQKIIGIIKETSGNKLKIAKDFLDENKCSYSERIDEISSIVHVPTKRTENDQELDSYLKTLYYLSRGEKTPKGLL